MANKIAEKPVVKTKKLTKIQLAKDMGISRGMLYYEHKQPLIDAEVKNQIEAILSTKGKESYGHKRIALELKLNKKRILRVMKKFNIKPYKRRFKKPNKKEDHNKPATKYLNLIKNLCPIAPNVVWVSDFTFIRYQYRFIYLATIEDMYTREILGYNISRFHNSELIAGAFKDALVYTKNKISTYIHSDQGSEYDSRSYINLIEIMGIQISMSKKASPWENGYQESFYSQFKLDLGDTNRFNGIGELIEEIEHMIYRHNNIKTHSVLKTNPVNYRKLWESKVLSFSEDKLFNKLGTWHDEDVTPEVGELGGIYVHPDYDGKGIGSELMKTFLEVLKSEGYKKATLWVLDTNKKTRDWYESKGWRVEGREKTEPRDGFDLHEVRYIIDL